MIESQLKILHHDLRNFPELVSQEHKDSPASQESKMELRRTVGQANWAARRTRPDVGFDLMELSMRFNNANVADLRRAKKVVDKLMMEEMTILFPRLTGRLSVVTYCEI